MKEKIIVAAVQMKVLSASNNLPEILNYIKKASTEKADIICFPECSFNPNTDNPSSAKDLLPIQENCKNGNIFAIINGYFKDKRKNIYNRSYLINNKGKILGHYDKIHLWINEIKDVTPGKKEKIFDTPLGKIGMCICWDIFFPAFLEKLREGGAELVFCPSYWKDDFGKETKFVESAPVVMAYQYMQYFVFCNALLSKTGITQIAAPWGSAKKIKFKEGMIVANLYADRLKRLKKNFKKAFWEKTF